MKLKNNPTRIFQVPGYPRDLNLLWRYARLYINPSMAIIKLKEKIRGDLAVLKRK